MAYRSSGMWWLLLWVLAQCCKLTWNTVYNGSNYPYFGHLAKNAGRNQTNYLIGGCKRVMTADLLSAGKINFLIELRVYFPRVRFQVKHLHLPNFLSVKFTYFLSRNGTRNLSLDKNLWNLKESESCPCLG